MVIVADAQGRTDGSAYEMLQRVNSKYPIVLATKVDGFVFNKAVKLPDKYILADFSEHGWDFDWSNGTPFFGSRNWFGLGDSELDKFSNFVAEHPPLIYFKRELLRKDESKYYRPIEYPANHKSDRETLQDYNSRPIEVFFDWGLSNPMRPKLHGEIWSKMNKLGYIVCDNIYNVNGFLGNENNPRKWLTVNTPHYARFPIETILQINGLSKLSVCLHGAGRKCFRTTGESPLNSVMILPEDHMAYAFNWIDGFNCIKIKDMDNAVEEIDAATKRDDLFSIYLEGTTNCSRYDIKRYISEYIEPIINSI